MVYSWDDLGGFLGYPKYGTDFFVATGRTATSNDRNRMVGKRLGSAFVGHLITAKPTQQLTITVINYYIYIYIKKKIRLAKSPFLLATSPVCSEFTPISGELPMIIGLATYH